VQVTEPFGCAAPCVAAPCCQVLRGNIRVMCRVRPLQQGSSSSSSGSSSSSRGGGVIGYPLEGSLSVSEPMSSRTRDFEFDAVFGPDVTQEQVRRKL
jgi:hypothetical protein